MDHVRIVFFDAGGTLLRPQPDVGEVYAAAGRRYGVDVTAPQIEEAFRGTFIQKKLDGRPQDRAWWREVVLDTFSRFGEATHPESLFEDLYHHFTSPSSWCLFEGARETVLGCQERGFATGLISNWDDRLPELLDGLELSSLLEPQVISFAVGIEKPHPTIFETALERAGVRPHEALMVGDDAEADVLGALAVGMPAVHVRRDGRTLPDTPGITHLHELLDLLPRRAPG